MKPTLALLAVFSVACGGASGETSGLPTAPTAVALPPTLVEGGQLFTYQNAVAFLPTGTAEYNAAIVFLPGLRDPATGNDLDSRALVQGTPGGGCSIWCSPAERAEVRSRALKLAGGNVALVGTTTLVDNPASYETLLRALSDSPRKVSILSWRTFPSFSSGTRWGDARRTGSAAFMARGSPGS